MLRNRFVVIVSVVLLCIASPGVRPVSTQGPDDTNPWENPALHQCIDNWLTTHMTDPTVCPPRAAPCRGVDEWGNLMTAGYVGASQPDDWHNWYNRWHRIACLWEEPASGAIRAACQAPPCNWQPGMPSEAAQPIDQPPVTDVSAIGPITTVLEGAPEGFTFYAVYDLLLGTEQSGLDFTHMVMSDDGQQILFSAMDHATGVQVLGMMRTDGSAPAFISLPDLEGRWIEELAIDYDGSHAYFRATSIPMGVNDWLFAVGNGAATRIFETTPYLSGDDPIDVVEQIQTTADGGAVYFKDLDDIWRVMYAGGSPQKVIEDTTIPRNDALVAGPGNVRIRSFSISDDASAIALIGLARTDPATTSGFSVKPEIFLAAGGAFRQITNDPDPVTKELVAISGDGTAVIYATAYPPQWLVSHHGGAPVPLEAAGSNFGGMDLTFDGSLWVYFDTAARGGRIVHTDGTGGLDLFPRTWMGGIMIEATNDTSISDDGTVVSFRTGQGLYVGFLNDPGAVPAAPVIQSIAFASPEPDSGYARILTAHITGAGSLVTGVDQLLAGRLVPEDQAPLGFPWAPNDQGEYPDVAAGDGVFTSGGRHHASGSETVRVAAMDSDRSVTLADVLVSEP